MSEDTDTGRGDPGTVLRRLWPDPSPDRLTDDDLLAGYRPADRDRPFLRANFVTSADGAVSREGYSTKLSGPADKRVFGLVRMVCDALMVGAGTLRHERYRPVRLDARRRGWRQANGLAEYPALVIVSSRLALDPAHPVFAEAPVRPVVVTHGGAPVDRRDALAAVADVLVHGDAEVDLAAAKADLADRGLRQVLCEGGPRLFGSLLGAGAVDELCLTLSPQLAGAGAGRIAAGPPGAEPLPARPALVLLSDGGELLLRYAVSPSTPG
jgi:riboflavin biosynthesis pyrimidine reductase